MLGVMTRKRRLFYYLILILISLELMAIDERQPRYNIEIERGFDIL
jgi:hypothetical protein